MSKERARRRAEQRQQQARPKARPTAGATPRVKAKPPRSRREQRRRQRWLLMGGGWLAVNVVSFLVADSWATRWIVLFLSTIAVPVLVWLLWDPEGRVDL